MKVMQRLVQVLAWFGLVASPLLSGAAYAEDTGLLMIRALGGETWNCTNDNGVRCYNYSRGNHRLRFEDANVHFDGDNEYWGTFTITNRKRLQHDPHLFVRISINQGEFEIFDVKTDGGNKWWSVIPDEVAYEGVQLNDVLDVVFTLGINGDAQGVMANSAWEAAEYLRRLSAEQSSGEGLTAGVYTIQQRSTGRYMDAWVTNDHDYDVVTRTRQNNQTQKWYIRPVSGKADTYTIQQMANSRYLDAHEYSGKDFRVVTRPSQSNETQQWEIVRDSGSRTYRIRQVSSGRYMDAYDTPGDKDYSVVTRDYQGNRTQQWLIAK
jgi:hypothetical protein